MICLLQTKTADTAYMGILQALFPTFQVMHGDEANACAGFSLGDQHATARVRVFFILLRFVVLS